VKNRSKIVVSVILILLTVGGFVAKYWTNGIYPGQPFSAVEIITAAGEGNYQGMIPVWMYESAFGRTTIVWTLDMGSDSFRKLFNLMGRKQIVLSTQTVTPGGATHLDFFNALNSPRQFKTLVEDAGTPISADGSVYTVFTYMTIDGYKYRVRVDRAGLCIVEYVIDPDGNYLTNEQIDALTVKVLVFYLGIAAVLGVALVVLLKKYNAIRKRKAATQPD